MKSLIFIPFLFLGCANVSTTRFEFVGLSGSRVVVEMPKEVEAEDLNVSIDALNGSATITAKKWSSKNVDTIVAQSGREESVTKGAAKGIIEGAIEGAKGIP